MTALSKTFASVKLIIYLCACEYIWYYYFFFLILSILRTLLLLEIQISKVILTVESSYCECPNNCINYCSCTGDSNHQCNDVFYNWMSVCCRVYTYFIIIVLKQQRVSITRNMCHWLFLKNTSIQISSLRLLNFWMW